MIPSTFRFPNLQTKRFATLLIALACILFLPAPSLAAIDQDRGLAIAYEAIAEHLGLQREDVTFYQTGVFEETGNRRFSFLLKNRPQDKDGLILVDITAQGEIAQFTEPRTIDILEQIGKALDVENYEAFTLEDLHALRLKWEPHREEIRQALAQTRGKAYYKAAAGLLLADIQLPGEDMISREAALEKAIDTIAALPGWNREKLDRLPLYIEVFHHSEALERPVYQFVFSRTSSASAAYFNQPSEKYETQYLEPLYAAFGGTNETTPLYVSVVVDGATGEPIGQPYVKFTSMDELVFTMVK